MALVRVASTKDLKSGQGKPYTVNGKRIAVFNVDGKFYAMDNTCLHRGGPVGEGEFDGTVVTCPWHGWQYDVTSGACQTKPPLKLNSYKVEVHGDDIMVDM